MSTKIKLSICIPTYNRPEKLEVVLLQLIPQLTSDCELLIRDDSNNEDTASLIGKLQRSKKVKISLYRGHKIGLDLANLFLLEKAKGIFVWWVSDDEEVGSSAVEKIIETIDNNHQTTFIWLNFISSFSGKLAVPNRSDGFFENNADFFDTVGPSIGLLSCLVIRRLDSLPFLEMAKSKEIGFGFAALIPIFGAISKNDKIYFLKGPLIVNHPTDMQTIEEQSKLRVVDKGSLAFEVYAINFPDTLRIFETNLDKNAIRRLVARNFSNFWRGFVIGIGKGYDTVRGKRIELIRRYWWHPEFFLAFALMHMPQLFLITMYKIYKIIKSKTAQRA